MLTKNKIRIIDDYLTNNEYDAVYDAAIKCWNNNCHKIPPEKQEKLFKDFIQQYWYSAACINKKFFKLKK